MPETAAQPASLAQLVAGHAAEWDELLDVLAEHRGLTAVIADPLSGTSALLSTAIEKHAAPGQGLLVDARRCADAVDLAMAIGDAAVAKLAPEAQAWWLGTAPPPSTAGLRLARSLSDRGLDLDPLRRGETGGGARLGEALELAVALAEGTITVAVDHLGTMLGNLRTESAREILGELRTARQRTDALDLVLVDHPRGPIEQALGDPAHPLYRAGERMRIARPRPDQLVSDLAVLQPATDVTIEVLRVAAELAAGVPALTWATVGRAAADGDSGARALAGWQTLRIATATSVRQQWDLLRRVHPAAQTMVGATSLGLKPHSVALASKTVDDALNRLRAVGQAWQPAARQWAVADPLLAAYAREHAPPWALRRTGRARTGLAG